MKTNLRIGISGDQLLNCVAIYLSPGQSQKIPQILEKNRLFCPLRKKDKEGKIGFAVDLDTMV